MADQPAIEWNDSFYLKAYLLSKSGMTDSKIRAMIGVHWIIWRAWKAERPALVEAIERGQQARKEKLEIVPKPEQPPDFHEYVFGQLPPNLKYLWNELESLEDDDVEAETAVRNMLANNGQRFRQGLFIHALTRSRFNLTTAMQKSMINHRTYERWLREDPEFAELVREVAFHRKNFFENALMRNVAAGDTQAIIFANKTQNKDRGYGDTLEVSHSGTINHAHVVVSIDELGLPTQIKRKILEKLKAIRLSQRDTMVEGNFSTAAVAN